jgi:Asp-tRNA(Asn)/Glu-tRNA(Gln) amidotransferase A subunit family amidase
MAELVFQSASALAKAIRQRLLSVVGVLGAYLQRVGEVNPQLNAVVDSVHTRE